VDQQRISDYISERLDHCDHVLAPGKRRLVLPDNGLIYYPVDNTRSGEDVGVQAYKAKLQELCEISDSVHMPVPFALIRLQDKVTCLTKKASIIDTTAMLQVRRKHGGSTVSYLCWEEFKEHDLQVLVDFMDLQGVVMHNNAESLHDLVIIDQEWLIKQLTMIIRDPRLHNKEVDKRMGRVAYAQLYEHGTLVSTLRLVHFMRL
jgi:hypothetical protein